MPKNFPEPLAWLAGLALAGTLSLPLVLAENGLLMAPERPVRWLIISEAQPALTSFNLIQPQLPGTETGTLSLPSAVEEAGALPSPPAWPSVWTDHPNPDQIAMAALAPTPELLDDLSGRVQPQAIFSPAAQDYEDIIETTAQKHQVSPLLIKAVIQAESRFNPSAVSHKGAVGLMQVLPSTARAHGVHNLLDPQLNLEAGTRHLKTLLEAYNDDEILALAAYNCGAEAMKRFNNKIPPFPETRNYVNRVMAHYSQHLEN